MLSSTIPAGKGSKSLANSSGRWWIHSEKAGVPY